MRDLFGCLPDTIVFKDDFSENRLFPLQLGEDSSGLLLRVLVPGIGKDKLQVEIDGQELCISGHIPPEAGQCHRHERATGFFRRRINLGVPVQADAVSAELRNGVLTLHLPKLRKAGARRIQLETID